jgi:hypothetical protein
MLIRLLLIGGGATYLYQRNKHNTKKTISPNFSGKKLLQDFKTAILGDERQQQQLTLDSEMQADIKKSEDILIAPKIRYNQDFSNRYESISVEVEGNHNA